jgi:hypothetical protein
MIDVSIESLVPITDAHGIIPGRPHLATVYRWWQKGVRGGIKLETALVGGRRFTSREAVQRFVERLSVQTPVVQGSAQGKRLQAAEKADKELAAAGW